MGTYYNLWMKTYAEATNLSEFKINFEKALKEAAKHGDVAKLDASLPDYYNGRRHDDWRQHDISCFFRPTKTNFKAYKNCDKVRSVDEMLNIYLETNDSSPSGAAGDQKPNNPSSSQSSNNSGPHTSRMDVKFKGRGDVSSKHEDVPRRTAAIDNGKNRVYVSVPTDDD